MKTINYLGIIFGMLLTLLSFGSAGATEASKILSIPSVPEVDTAAVLYDGGGLIEKLRDDKLCIMDQVFEMADNVLVYNKRGRLIPKSNLKVRDRIAYSLNPERKITVIKKY